MNLNDLLIEAVTLVDTAVVEDEIGEPKLCIASLVKLRELLNAQPELEKGGANEHAKPSRPARRLNNAGL